MTIPVPNLGDFSQAYVGPQAAQIWSAQPGVQVTLANQDLVNTVTIGRVPTVTQNALNGLIIPPLGSVTVSGAKPLYAIAPANTSPLLVIPGGGNWAPAPSQVAASINALGLMKDTTGLGIDSTLTGGIPAVTNNDFLGSSVNQTILAGATLSAGTFTFNQPSYAIFFDAQCNAGSNAPFITARLTWTDSGSGRIVHTDEWTSPITDTAGGGLLTAGYGPTHSDTLTVELLNVDGAHSMTNVDIFVFQSSRYYTIDTWLNHWDPATFANMPNVPTFQIGAGQRFPTSGILFSVNRGLGNGLTTTPDYILPLYSGTAYWHFHGVTSNNWYGTMVNAVTGNGVHRFRIGGINEYNSGVFNLGRMPVALNFSNTGSVNGTLDTEIHIVA